MPPKIYFQEQLIPFVFAFDRVPLNNVIGAQGTSTRVTDSDAFLIVTEWLYSSTTMDGDAVTPEECTILVTNASNVQLSNGPVPNPVFAGPIGGNVEEGFCVAFRPNSQLTLQLANLTATARTVTVAVKGFKVPLNSPLVQQFGLLARAL
jgi:hypothetical protein